MQVRINYETNHNEVYTVFSSVSQRHRFELLHQIIDLFHICLVKLSKGTSRDGRRTTLMLIWSNSFENDTAKQPEFV